jgi:hypothetical protein
MFALNFYSEVQLGETRQLRLFVAAGKGLAFTHYQTVFQNFQ